MKRSNLSITFILLLFVIQCYCRNYTNYSLLQFTPKNKQQLDFINNIHAKSVYDIIFWRYPTKIGFSVEFIINPDHKASFNTTCKVIKIVLKEIIVDVQSAFNDQVAGYLPYERRYFQTLNWRSFPRISDIYNWMNDMQMEFPDAVTIKTIGHSIEGRDIKVAIYNAKDYMINGFRKKKAIVIEGGIHAREWISPLFVLYLMDKIIHAHLSSDPVLRKSALLYNWYFIPVLNPDGYEYSHVVDRLWRKNRNPKGAVDLNRNFDVAFGTLGSRNVKDNEYGGSKPFSEPESMAFANFLKTIEDIEYYIAVHSYGQVLIIPYCYTTEMQDNYGAVLRLCEMIAQSIKKQRGTNYSVGNVYQVYGYLGAGVSMDWAKRLFSIPYVFTLELNDKGGYRFAMPTDEIIPVCEETFSGLLAMFSDSLKSQARKIYGIGTEEDEDFLESDSVLADISYVILFFNLYSFFCNNFL